MAVMRRIGFAAPLLVTAAGLLAQATGTTTADLRGLVVDETGSPLPGASIIATSQDTGFSRQATSAAGGSFAVRLLPPGLYRVSASLPGLRVADVPDVRLSVGATTTLELRLEPSGVAEAVSVTAQMTLIDRSSTELSKTVGESKIRNLPINQRNFLEFALTTPGVTVARGPQAGPFPTSGISISGQSPRLNNIVVDGVDNNDSAVGSVRSTFSQDAVREYQVIQSPFPAEYGKATGGVVNVVTRSGSNDWHGSAFAFFRDESLSADNFLTGTTTPFQQTQYGANFSGPILKDRLFFFAAAERLAVHDANVVTLSDADVAMIRSSGFDVQNGAVPFERSGTSWLGKLDVLPSPSHAISLRGTYARALDGNLQPWGGLVARSNGGAGKVEDAAAALAGTLVLSASLSNELRALYADRSLRLDSLDLSRGPQVSIINVATFGTQTLLPEARDTQVYEIFDAVSWFGSKSAYKAGFDYTRTTSAMSVPANFAGLYVFGSLDEGLPGVPAGGLDARQAFAAGLPSMFGQTFGDPNFEATTNVLGAFVQGEWNLTDRLLLRLGLRYDYEKPADPFPSDTNNWAPRFSFSWAGGDSWRVRGGLGRFYGVAAIVPALAVTVTTGVQTTGISLRLDGASADLSPAEPWGLPGRRFPDATSAGAGLGPQSAVRPAGCEYAMPPNLDLESCARFESAYTDQANLGFEVEIGPRLLFNADYLYARGRKIMESRNINPLINGGPRPNPAFDNIVVDSASGNSWYNGVTAGLQTRSGGPFEMSAFYTWADARDDYIDWLTQRQLQDPLNPQDERGPSIHVPRHRATLTAITTTVGRPLPWYLRDWTVATIAAFEAGRPFNVLAGFDRNRNGDRTSDRPEGVSRNSGVLPDSFNVDLRVARTIPVGPVALEATMDVFNLFNRRNVLEVNAVRYLTSHLVPNPQFGAPTIVADPRRVQFGLRASF
jgi:hypothetical protein